MFKTTNTQSFNQHSKYGYNYQPKIQPHNQLNHKTSICKYAKIGCKQRDTCWYAHNKEELRYRKCSNGINCLKNECPFVHGDILPDKDVYYLRVILNTNIIGIDSNLIIKELNTLANRENKQKQMQTYKKFVIELDEDDMNCEDERDDMDEILDGISNLEIGKWGDYEENTEDDKMDIDCGNKECVDLELSKHIDEFTRKWDDKENREQFYDKKELEIEKKDINMTVNVSDKEFDDIIRYLNSMNIEYVKL